MPWGRCDDKFWRHLKTLALDERYRADAIALYWMVISWSNDELADGKVSLATVRMLGFAKPAADELVRVRLWEGFGRAGYQVHDYFHFNKSRAQVLAERQKWADEKAAQRGKSTPDSTADIDTETSNVHGRQEGSEPPMSTPDSTADSRVGARPRAGGGRDAAAPRSPVLPYLPDSRDSRSPDSIPPPPAERGRRSRGTSPRQQGANPRAQGESPRQNGSSTRQVREEQKRGPIEMPTGELERIRAERARFDEVLTPEERAAAVAAYRAEHPVQPRPPVPTKAADS